MGAAGEGATVGTADGEGAAVGTADGEGAAVGAAVGEGAAVGAAAGEGAAVGTTDGEGAAVVAADGEGAAVAVSVGAGVMSGAGAAVEVTAGSAVGVAAGTVVAFEPDSTAFPPVFISSVCPHAVNKSVNITAITDILFFISLPPCPLQRAYQCMHSIHFNESLLSKFYSFSSFLSDRGRENMDSLPAPSVLITLMCSSWLLMISFTMESPSPVPFLSLPRDMSDL